MECRHNHAQRHRSESLKRLKQSSLVWVMRMEQTSNKIENVREDADSSYKLYFVSTFDTLSPKNRDETIHNDKQSGMNKIFVSIQISQWIKRWRLRFEIWKVMNERIDCIDDFPTFYKRKTQVEKPNYRIHLDEKSSPFRIIWDFSSAWILSVPVLLVDLYKLPKRLNSKSFEKVDVEYGITCLRIEKYLANTQTERIIKIKKWSLQNRSRRGTCNGNFHGNEIIFFCIHSKIVFYFEEQSNCASWNLWKFQYHPLILSCGGMFDFYSQLSKSRTVSSLWKIHDVLGKKDLSNKKKWQASARNLKLKDSLESFVSRSDSDYTNWMLQCSEGKFKPDV